MPSNLRLATREYIHNITYNSNVCELYEWQNCSLRETMSGSSSGYNKAKGRCSVSSAQQSLRFSVRAAKSVTVSSVQVEQYSRVVQRHRRNDAHHHQQHGVAYTGVDSCFSLWHKTWSWPVAVVQFSSWHDNSRYNIAQKDSASMQHLHISGTSDVTIDTCSCRANNITTDQIDDETV